MGRKKFKSVLYVNKGIPRPIVNMLWAVLILDIYVWPYRTGPKRRVIYYLTKNPVNCLKTIHHPQFTYIPSMLIHIHLIVHSSATRI